MLDHNTGSNTKKGLDIQEQRNQRISCFYNIKSKCLQQTSYTENGRTLNFWELLHIERVDLSPTARGESLRRNHIVYSFCWMQAIKKHILTSVGADWSSSLAQDSRPALTHLPYFAARFTCIEESCIKLKERIKIQYLEEYVNHIEMLLIVTTN